MTNWITKETIHPTITEPKSNIVAYLDSKVYYAGTTGTDAHAEHDV